MQQYICCFTGPIGVGKSTMFNKTYEYLNDESITVHPVYEYIDGEKRTSGSLSGKAANKTDGERMLSLYLNGELTDSVFQNYIQNYYINISHKMKDKKGVILMERSMSDSVAIFCNLANQSLNKYGHQKLSDGEIAEMYKNCIYYDKIADFPNFFIKNYKLSIIMTTTVDETFEAIRDIINDDLANNVSKRVIALVASPRVCYKRVCQRAREGESAYSMEYMKHHCNMYMRLFRLMADPSYERIRLLDLGYLTHTRTNKMHILYPGKSDIPDWDTIFETDWTSTDAYKEYARTHDV